MIHTSLHENSQPGIGLKNLERDTLSSEAKKSYFGKSGKLDNEIKGWL
jgi:hypothetical protein